MRTHLALVLVVASLAFTLSGCVTVRPHQRAILADPIMRVGGSLHDQSEAAHTQHALDNREGAFGGEGVSGGGCGCN